MPRGSSSGSDRSPRHHTGYLSTPAQWGPGARRSGAPPPSAPPYVNSTAATVGSSVVIPDSSAALPGLSATAAGTTTGNGYSSKNGTGPTESTLGSAIIVGARRSGDGSAADEADEADEAGGTSPHAGSVGAGAGPSGAQAEGSGRLVRGGSVASDRSSVYEDDDWHDARSVASNWSYKSGSSLAAINDAGIKAARAGAAAAAAAATAAVAAAKDLPSLSNQQDAAARSNAAPAPASPDSNAPATTTAAAAVVQPPQVRVKRQRTPEPTAQSDHEASVTGQFSTPVLAAPHRTGSMPSSSIGALPIPASAHFSADAEPLAASSASPAAAVAAVPIGQDCDVSGASLRVRPVPVGLPLPAAVAPAAQRSSAVALPLPSPRPALRLGVEPRAAPLRAGEDPDLPAWVPPQVIPGLDPATRFVPIPRHTGLEGYWEKVPELSSPLPMPLDVFLKASYFVRTIHESIKGIALEEDDKTLVVKARVKLPLGMTHDHEERYPKDNSTHTVLIRRDVTPGRSITRMYWMEDGSALLVCDSVTMYGTVDRKGYEVVRKIEGGSMLHCRQWVVIVPSGEWAEQVFVGRKTPLSRK
ncbi:hypothetical protein GPECTOR_29g116 [Gonium pectorale]|uniref:Uncharacterized protein n=1 Tax=Gonium pectorale TaxID=33097 RepID=A0A150GFV4_GONPE|nr:hypothetical protein GPECTOR_29g116 [Gonium pectorale]|eukprot:KXZ48210.1 hypothetical protein GPECTOR_29g116 [Gonium pectorale]